MNIIRLIALLFIGATTALSAPPTAPDSTKVPDDVNRLKQNFQQSVERAVQPLRARYVADIKRLLDQYTRAGKLELAVAVKSEIDAISAGVVNSTDTLSEFERRLIGTKWTWNGTFTVDFQPGGKSSERGFTWKTVKPYTLEYEFPDANHGTIVFERAMLRAAIHEVTASGTKNPMTLFRVKE